ncbi:TPA: hypothetical protein L5Y18_001697 [Pseudomonas aeruginosa]|uniref:hypothetical protein n=1 Tax=Pseudomonas aeruginosa TaxID=287 RepID=UPI00159CDD9B|nr:hypothetical protein [Pseudomonas aeruginosa]QKZ90984.1 hypothetical protein HWN48_22755 [Pseudomonas aeruginosa]HBP2068922.1 hypothetical protein [Pseudomonas aeruginosa]HBP2106785.1 hypothetical protein [Pseudomonas aeruginosa]HBP2501737.1 hypothetical protein [Pseudomonas aeruginosa]HBP2515673.1 hypothetical protein [Pseudomonas aeruginosa]
MSIDWSKAPEGCIGAFARIISKTAFFVFSKRPSDYMSREGYEGEGEDGDYHVFSEFWEWIDKPWDGQGLPPVGTVCIVEPHNTLWGFSSTSGHERKILAYHTDYVWLGNGDTPLETTRIDKVYFRPIRTPEQIAAEEREKAVGDMAMSIQGVPYQYPTLYALYDAGYRRQESST